MCPTVIAHDEENINLSFKITPNEHSLLNAISVADHRSMAKEVRSLIQTRAKELGFLKEDSE